MKNSIGSMVSELIRQTNKNLTITPNGGILLRLLSDHLENPEHHPFVIGCDYVK